MPDHQAFVSLGSNIAPERHLEAAVRALAREPRVALIVTSSVLETAPVHRPDQDVYLNAAVLIRTDVDLDELRTAVFHPIEDRLGRTRGEDRFAPRTIDLDLVLFDEVVQPGPPPLPHPDLLAYVHVALPISELDPRRPHPVTGEPLEAIARRLARRSRWSRREGLRLSDYA